MKARGTRSRIATASSSPTPNVPSGSAWTQCGLFDLALPITTDQPFDPQEALAAGRYHGEVITVDSEFEWVYARAAEDRGGSPELYRRAALQI